MSLFGILKKLALFVLIVAVAIPLRYGSTDPQYLFIRLLHSTLSLKHILLTDQARPTLSAEYRAFEEIVRMQPALELDPLEDPLPFIKETRAKSDIAMIFPKPSHCTVNKEVFHHDGHTVDAYWIDQRQPSLQEKSDIILLYFHGGGYLSGDIHGFSRYECHLSQLFNLTILHVEYRLSPEYPLPAAVDDTIAVYRSLLRNNISSSQLLIMGDSAGGGLSLLTIQALLTHKLPVPHSVIAVSPWADLSISGESYTRNHLTDVMLNKDKNHWMVKSIMSANPAELALDSPIISPMFGSFKGFPQMYINVGSAEVLEDDSRVVVKKAQDAGVNVTFEIGLHMMHVYPIFYPYYPEARNTLDNINKWIQSISSKTERTDF